MDDQLNLDAAGNGLDDLARHLRLMAAISNARIQIDLPVDLARGVARAIERRPEPVRLRVVELPAQGPLTVARDHLARCLAITAVLALLPGPAALLAEYLRRALL